MLCWSVTLLTNARCAHGSAVTFQEAQRSAVRGRPITSLGWRGSKCRYFLHCPSLMNGLFLILFQLITFHSISSWVLARWPQTIHSTRSSTARPTRLTMSNTRKSTLSAQRTMSVKPRRLLEFDGGLDIDDETARTRFRSERDQTHPSQS